MSRRDLGRMPRSEHDRRTAEQFAADLWRETDASLRRDPSRWPTNTVEDLPSRKANQAAQSSENHNRVGRFVAVPIREVEVRVLAALGAGPLRRSEVIAVLALPVNPVIQAMRRLRAAGRIEVEQLGNGTGSATVWRLVEPS